MRQVFDGQDLNSIMLELLELRRGSQPLVVQRTMMVRENRFAGVLESYQANVLFVVNSMVGKDWPGFEVGGFALRFDVEGFYRRGLFILWCSKKQLLFWC